MDVEQRCVPVGSLFVRADLFIAGLGLDLIGAGAMAWPILTRAATEIATLYQLGGYDMATLNSGNPDAARKAARETANTRLGVALLIFGFTLQGAGYFAHVRRGLEGSGEALGASLIFASELAAAGLVIVLLVRWLTPRILGAAQTARPSSAAPPPPRQAQASWTEADEIQRLDALAGVLLQTAFGVVIAGVTIAATVNDLSRSIRWVLVAGAGGAGVAGMLALFALYYSPLNRSLGEIVRKKGRRTLYALGLLACSVEAVALIGIRVNL